MGRVHTCNLNHLRAERRRVLTARAAARLRSLDRATKSARPAEAAVPSANLDGHPAG
jgi:hypothetical protein